MSGDCSSRKIKRFSESDRSAEFDAATQKALEDIDICQNEIDNINEKASEEILKVERKYNQLRKPFFDNRNLIISNIPNFWITAVSFLVAICLSLHLCIQRTHFSLQLIYIFLSATPTSESTQIIWKEGCTLGQNVESNRTGRKRRHEPSKTFFGWFNDNVDPYTDDIAEVIKDDLWLNPLQYYLVPDVEGDGENGMEGEEASSSDENDDIVEDDDSKTK
nr:protein SET [Leptinotarsa decemlineata]